MKNVIGSVKGTRDFYPDEMSVRRWLLDTMRDVSSQFGYQEYDGPCVEKIDLYAAKSGEELVKEQSFVFPDRGGELIALRPELTPTLARMIANKQNELIFPLRWWSFGPFWRYERPQRGRSREFFQWNVDLIGTSNVESDAEVVAVAARFFERVGLKSDQIKILVNNRRLMDKSLDKIGIPESGRLAVFRLIDKIDKMSTEKWEAYALEIGLTSKQLEGLRIVLSNKSLWEESEELRSFFKTVTWLGVEEYVRFEPQVIRGLDYYTGTVFEGRDEMRKFRAIFGGGHYDNLVADVGGNPLPGVGFAMGDVVIQLLLEEYCCIPDNVMDPPSVLVTVFDENTIGESYRTSTLLREAGLNVVTFPQVEKLGKQFRFADRMGIRVVVVAGPDELAVGKVMIKNLLTREQESVGIEQAANFIRSLLAQEMAL